MDSHSHMSATGQSCITAAPFWKRRNSPMYYSLHYLLLSYTQPTACYWVWNASVFRYVGSRVFCSRINLSLQQSSHVQGLVFAELIHSEDYVSFYTIQHWHNTPQAGSVCLAKRCVITSKEKKKTKFKKIRPNRFNFSSLVLW